ncbi:MAG: division/cell wall cluster transcriptional repressor MraZ [Bacteroidota bacterium]
MEQQELLGEHNVTLDGKGRFRLPSSLLNSLGEREDIELIVNRGFEKCLTLYPKPIWERISSEVNKLNKYNERNRQFVRYFYRGATPIKLDSADRINLPQRLIEYAGIQKEVILSAMHDRIEIWARTVYDNMLDAEPENFSALAEQVLGGSQTELEVEG